jgi:hypothetical protein
MRNQILILAAFVALAGCAEQPQADREKSYWRWPPTRRS